MKSLLVVTGICLLVFAFVFSCKNKAEPEVYVSLFDTAGYQPIPAGYGYMQDTALLSAAVAKGDTAYVREHGWKLWAGIMQPMSSDSNAWPVWYTWPNTQQACSMTDANSTALLKSGMNTLTINSLIKVNKANIPAGGAIMDNIPTPIYNVPDTVAKMFPGVVVNNNINPGKHFLFNQDIMIPTESLSIEGYDWVRKNNLYNPNKLDSLKSAYTKGQGQHVLSTPATQIITKHMFWPVPANGLYALPVWNNDFDSSYTKYAGYEEWKTLIAIDATGNYKLPYAPVTYLHGVLRADSTPYQPITRLAKVHKLNEFYYHRITQQDWDSFDANDKAILNASSFWAYKKAIGVGDYLVTIAMHVNTKEVPTWALQSVFWSDNPDAGQYSTNRPSLPGAKGPWAHYKLVDGYGIPNQWGKLPVGMNPYIELVIHPVATNCNNCHIRAGWPEGKTGDSASYQNPNCLDLLGKFSMSQTSCLQSILLTDFQWFLSDDAKGNITSSKMKK